MPSVLRGIQAKQGSISKVLATRTIASCTILARGVYVKRPSSHRTPFPQPQCQSVQTPFLVSAEFNPSLFVPRSRLRLSTSTPIITSTMAVRSVPFMANETDQLYQFGGQHRKGGFVYTVRKKSTWFLDNIVATHPVSRTFFAPQPPTNCFLTTERTHPCRAGTQTETSDSACGNEQRCPPSAYESALFPLLDSRKDQEHVDVSTLDTSPSPPRPPRLHRSPGRLTV